MMCRLGQAFRLGQQGFPPGGHPGRVALNNTLRLPGGCWRGGKNTRAGRKKLVNAMGIAYHQCSGNGQCVNEGSLTKRLGAGFSVRGGITAAFMAERHHRGRAMHHWGTGYLQPLPRRQIRAGGIDSGTGQALYRADSNDETIPLLQGRPCLRGAGAGNG